MKVIGVRNSTDTMRFAVIEKDGTGMHFLNADDGNRIVLPKTISDRAARMAWARQELDRVIAGHGPIAGIALKQNENQPKAYTQTVAVAFLDALWFLAAGEKAIRIESYVFRQLGTRTADVCTDAMKHVPASTTHWDPQMGAAVMAAVHMIEGL